MNHTRRVDALPALAAGVLVSVAFQAAAGWWLNSGPRVAAGELAFLILAAAVTRFGGPKPAARLAALWLGVQIGLAAFLFWMGAGTIWPITLAIGGVLSAMAIAIGGGATYLLTASASRST